MSEPMNKDVHEANRRSWNAATVAHNSHKRDQADFLRRGGSTLFPQELSLLGNVAGRRLVHLQCNAGQDTLSLAQLGAMVTGVDISDEAIDFARKLSADTGIPATFHRADVYDWFDTARQRGEQFDIVFCSYGCVCWLSDLDRWAAGISSVLAPGGRFVAVDFHPVALMFDEHLNLAFPYFGKGEPLQWEDGVSDYVAASGPAMTPSGYQEGVHDFKNPHAAYEFQWNLGAILAALLQSGLLIEQFREYPFFNAARLYDDMREENRRMYPPGRVPSLPLMFGVVAAKLSSNRA